MAAQKYYEGQEFPPKDPRSGLPVLVYRAGKFYPKQDQPAGQSGPEDAPAAPLTPGAETRARFELGIGPVVNAQRNIYSAEGGGDRAKRHNPFNDAPVRSAISSLDNGKLAEWAGFSLDPLARGWPGKNQQSFQDYDQASKSFEASMLPILSGSAVTPSEAQRQIRARLPAWGDTPLTLERKATERAMMANAAAELVGKPRPFPKVGVWDFHGTGSGSQPRAGQPRAPNTGPQQPAAPQVGQVVKGYRFRGGNPADRNSWEPAPR
jgi:hypothetical protein